MRVIYRTKKLERVCEDFGAASRKYGARMADKIHTRVSQLTAALSVEHLLRGRVGRCHALTGDRAGEYAMDLIHPYRLIFTEINENVICVRIEEITDYH